MKEEKKDLNTSKPAANVFVQDKTTPANAVPAQAKEPAAKTVPSAVYPKSDKTETFPAEKQAAEPNLPSAADNKINAANVQSKNISANVPYNVPYIEGIQYMPQQPVVCCPYLMNIHCPVLAENANPYTMHGYHAVAGNIVNQQLNAAQGSYIGLPGGQYSSQQNTYGYMPAQFAQPQHVYDPMIQFATPMNMYIPAKYNQATGEYNHMPGQWDEQ